MPKFGSYDKSNCPILYRLYNKGVTYMTATNRNEWDWRSTIETDMFETLEPDSGYKSLEWYDWDAMVQACTNKTARYGIWEKKLPPQYLLRERATIYTQQFLNKSFLRHNSSQHSLDMSAVYPSHSSTPQCILELDMVAILHHCIWDFRPWNGVISKFYHD